MPDTEQAIIQEALKDNQGRFIAAALAEVPTGEIRFLHADKDLPTGFAAALAELAARAAAFTENHDQFDGLNEVLFYDIEGRQVILYLIERPPGNHVLVVVAAPQKAYKQASKRLAKALQSCQP